MGEKKTTIGTMGEKRQDDHYFSPLSQYDDLAAKEVEDLSRQSEALVEEMKSLTAELEQLKEQLEFDYQKGRMQALRVEQSMHEEKILELQIGLPLLREEAASFHFETDPSRIEEEFARLTARNAELLGKQEDLTHELQLIDRETANRERGIVQSEGELREIERSMKTMEAETGQLTADITGLKRFEAALPGAQSGETERAYSYEVAALGEGLQKNDPQALARAQQLVESMGQKYQTAGKELRGLMSDLARKLSLVLEVREKEEAAASEVARAALLQGKADEMKSSMEELRALNSEDRRLVAALEAEIGRCRTLSAGYAEEASRGNEAAREKEAAASEFVTLFAGNAVLRERLLKAAGKMQSLGEMMEEIR